MKGTIPLVQLVQENKGKMRPVLDFRELNSHLSPHTADVDVFSKNVSKWRGRGQSVALVDFRKAYLQIHVDQSLWPYQTAVFQGHLYCLTRLCCGLSIAPLVI